MIIELAADTSVKVPAATTPASAGAAETATTRPAMTGQTVLLTGANDAVKRRLVHILAGDQIAVASVEPDEIVEAIERDYPSLLIISGEPDAGAIARMVRAIRKLPEPGGSLPVIVVGHDDQSPDSEKTGITDWLVEPFTDNYARNAITAWLMRRACKWALPPTPDNEEERLAALHGLNVLDTPSNRMLDAIVNWPLTCSAFPSWQSRSSTATDSGTRPRAASRRAKRRATNPSAPMWSPTAGRPCPRHVAPPRFAENRKWSGRPICASMPAIRSYSPRAIASVPSALAMCVQTASADRHEASGATGRAGLPFHGA